MKILLTGFEPFQGEKINPSQKLLDLFCDDLNIKTLSLPVSYERSWVKIEKELIEGKYQRVLMMGQDGGESKINLERVATNWIDSETADEDGVKIIETRISNGPEAFLSDLPLRDWFHQLQGKNHPVAISNSAGAYVCNALYYRVSEWQQNNQPGAQALFVHVPYLPEQTFGKNQDTPYLTLDVMRQTICALMKLFAQ